MGAFGIHLSALWSVITGRKPTFDITSKTKISGNFINLVKPHMLYALLLILGLGVAVHRENFSASVVANGAWGILNLVVFSEFFFAALPDTTETVPILKAPEKKRKKTVKEAVSHSNETVGTVL
jgi:cellulose synthase (UDP-forming)